MDGCLVESFIYVDPSHEIFKGSISIFAVFPFSAQVPCGQRFSTRPRMCAALALQGHAWATTPSASRPTTLSAPQFEWNTAMTPFLASLPEACESFVPPCATVVAAVVMEELCIPGSW